MALKKHEFTPESGTVDTYAITSTTPKITVLCESDCISSSKMFAGVLSISGIVRTATNSRIIQT